MPPGDVLGWLTSAGPYAVTVIVLVWLKLERDERTAAQADARTLRDQRFSEMKEQTELLAELGEITRNRLREHDEKIALALESIRPRGPS